MSGFYFAETQKGKARADFLFIDEQFVGSVFCVREGDRYQLDWWVTSNRPDSSPSLVLRVQSSFKAETSGLEKKLQSYWKRFYLRPAMASAKSGGITAETEDFKRLSRESQDNLVQGHLFAHDRNGHFNHLGYSKVAKTASMYLLLNSLGTKQPQKAIAAHEDPEMLGEVKTTAINQRLALAKRAGILPVSGETQHNSSDADTPRERPEAYVTRRGETNENERRTRTGT